MLFGNPHLYFVDGGKRSSGKIISLKIAITLELIKIISHVENPLA